MSKVRIGIVGTGFISDFHYNGFKKNTDAEIIGVCTHSNMEKLNKMCEEWNIKAYKNFDEMVDDPNIDALIIGSINTDHYPQILKSIKNGKHLLVEKPVVSDFEQLNEIEKASKESGILLFPGHNFVYREAVVKAKEVLENGTLGKIVYSSIISTHDISKEQSEGWRSKKALAAGGALMDSGHHLTYMSLYLMGMPKKIQAFKSNLVLNNMEGEDIAQINLLYPDNSIGCIMQSWTSAHGEGVNGINIVGEKGCLSITDGLYVNGEKLSSDVDYAVSFENQAKAFTDCILKGTKPISTIDDVRNTLKLIYKAYESSEKDAVISI
ncbi:MAG TPA: Gfo/Idh/MocA family oxidoreductase [Ruminiclostridium sp.]